MNHIRPAEKEDLPRIAEIHVLAWHDAYSDLIHPEILSAVTFESRFAAWQKWYENTDQGLHVLQCGDDIQGFIRTCPARDHENPPSNYGELTHLYLHPAHISKGAGHHLFEFAVSLCKGGDYSGMLLWTIEGNTRARRFYEAHGMRADGARVDEPEWLGEGVYEVRYILPFNA